MRRLLRLAALAAALLVLAGCQTIPAHKVHYRLVDQAQPPRGDVIVLPLDIKVKEMATSGLTEEVPAWTAQAVANFRRRLQQHNPEPLAGLRLHPLPELPAEEMARVEEHLALSDQVLGNAFIFTGQAGGEAWKHKARHFDYSIGPGLAFLAERTGADQALILMGADIHSSEGRKAAALVGAFFGAAIQLGHSWAVAALIDLRSGDVLWMNHYVSTGNVSFLNDSDTGTVVTELFKPYPGIEAYRKFVKGD